MKLVEQHIIRPNHQFWTTCDELCFKAKNLYNQALYRMRQQFFETGIVPHAFDLQKKMQQENQVDFRALRAQVAKQVLRMLWKNWRSFFNALKQWKVKAGNFLGKPKLPGYKDKNKGRFMAEFANPEAISQKGLKAGLLKLSGTNIELPVRKQNIKSVRIVPHFGYYAIEVIYEIQTVGLQKENGQYAAIDLGVNNLATLTFNTGDEPAIINGKPLKAINQFYNKKKAKLMSFVGNKGSSKKIEKLTVKRNLKIKDYLHKQTTHLANFIASKGVSRVAIGKNDNWKQSVNIGKVNNQKFVNIPFNRFIEMLDYKLQLRGIGLICKNENYTSKCSFLDNEPIGKQSAYKGKRIKRGLFKSADGTRINADVNASYNIGKKVFGNAYTADSIEGLALIPLKVKL